MDPFSSQIIVNIKNKWTKVAQDWIEVFSAMEGIQLTFACFFFIAFHLVKVGGPKVTSMATSLIYSSPFALVAWCVHPLVPKLKTDLMNPAILRQLVKVTFKLELVLLLVALANLKRTLCITLLAKLGKQI